VHAQPSAVVLAKASFGRAEFYGIGCYKSLYAAATPPGAEFGGYALLAEVISVAAAPAPGSRCFACRALPVGAASAAGGTASLA